MTIASEITRLQWAKADIRQAIIDKWVDVCADLTIDDYACCINDIPTGWGGKIVDVMVVAWWWWGGMRNYNTCKDLWWWWWAGWYYEECKHFISEDSYCIVVWTWWGSNTNWNPSCFWNEIIMLWWWHWDGYDWGSWWWASWCANSCNYYCFIWWDASACWILWWHPWGDMAFYYDQRVHCQTAWWWWWACWKWNWNLRYQCNQCHSWSFPWYWGLWVCNNFAWIVRCYAWWWWGGTMSSNNCYWYWCCWWWEWWHWSKAWCNATTYWSWWWWAWYNSYNNLNWWNWCQGIVIVRYPTDWSYGINSATGGNTCRTCTIDWVQYCIHEFTSNWTFTITG